MKTSTMAFLTLICGALMACEQEIVEQTIPEQLLYVWHFDAGYDSPNFLAVINADPASSNYGDLIDTIPVNENKGWAHHTSVVLPASGKLFANDFSGSYTYVYDTSNLLRPSIINEFGYIGDYSFPHSFSELPNGNILATFQSKGDANELAGGLIEFTAEGQVVRTSDAAVSDPAIFIRPYGIALVPELDRIITTSFDMRGADIGYHFQVWSLTSLELLHTIRLPHIDGLDTDANPFEARLLADGETVMLETLSCGLYVIGDIATDAPTVEYVHHFAEKPHCSLPVRLNNYWIQSVENDSGGFNGVVVLDITDPKNPVEINRLVIGDKMSPHWLSPNQSGTKIVVTGYGTELRRRIMMLDFDPQTGAISVDADFGEGDEFGPGLIIDREVWPHGATGQAIAHGSVFWPPAPPDWQAQ